MDKNKKKSIRTRLLILLWIVVIAAMYVYIYVYPEITDMFKDSYTAEFGTLQIYDEEECLIVRNEQVYEADNSGTVTRDFEEGALARNGSAIVSVGNTSYNAEARGIVSYYTDGLEETYTLENSSGLLKDVLDQIENDEEHQVTETGSTVAKGDPVFKIVDNSEWYLICWIPDDKISRYSEGKTITVEFLDGEDEASDTQVTMKVKSMVKKRGSDTVVALSCNRYYADFARYRTIRCKLITSNTSGILIETDSIVEEDGQQGVYVVNKFGNNKFYPIQILDQDGDTTVVEKNYITIDGQQVKTVTNYAEIARPDTVETDDADS